MGSIHGTMPTRELMESLRQKVGTRPISMRLRGDGWHSDMSIPEWYDAQYVAQTIYESKGGIRIDRRDSWVISSPTLGIEFQVEESWGDVIHRLWVQRLWDRGMPGEEKTPHAPHDPHPR